MSVPRSTIPPSRTSSIKAGYTGLYHIRPVPARRWLGVLVTDGTGKRQIPTVTERLKKTIDLGSEKNPPKEIDDLPVEHPAIAQATVTPHPNPGGEIHTAAVLAEEQGPGGSRHPGVRRHRDAAAHRPGRRGWMGRMKICIYGTGAIGGYLGFKLAAAGNADVSFIDRGDNLAALQSKGLTLREGAGERTLPVNATDDPSEPGPQDYVVVAVKAQSAPQIVDVMQPLLGPDTAVVTAMNGLPWWYFYDLEGPWKNRILHSVDPDGRQWKGIGPERAIGCVIYAAAELTAPGVVSHHYGDRFIVGEASGEKTGRVQALSRALTEAGLKAPVRNIRDEIWMKLWGNLCFNPLSALTTGTLEELAADPGTRAVARAMMLEAQAIGERLGVHFRLGIDKRIEGAESVGAHKTSMLQDLERGRRMEIDALLTVVQELGELVSVDTPTIDTVLSLVQQRARLAGCY